MSVQALVDASARTQRQVKALERLLKDGGIVYVGLHGFRAIDGDNCEAVANANGLLELGQALLDGGHVP